MIKLQMKKRFKILRRFYVISGTKIKTMYFQIVHEENRMCSNCIFTFYTVQMNTILRD